MNADVNLSPPRQAVILAGGMGTRLLPLTATTPKPMILFHGKPFLEYLINSLREQGIQKVLLLLGYLPEKVMDYFGDGSNFGIDISYNITPVEDETGTRLKRAIGKIEKHFLLLYCDNYLPFCYEKMWRVFCEQSVPAMVTVYDNADNYTKSNIRIDADGRIGLYDKTRTAENLQGVDIAYMIAERDILNLIPEGNVSFEKTVYPKLVQDRQLHAYVTHHRYYSVGDFRRMEMTKTFFAREPAVLIDRDGVLNKKMPKGEYVKSWADWQWLDGALDALRLFHERGYKTILISNQAGIARGVMTLNDLNSIHTRMKDDVRAAGGVIEAIYFCPHHWDEDCFCRKPKPGMLFAAQKDYHLDLSRTTFIGDDERDGLAADAAGAPWAKVDGNRSLYQIACEMTG
jgi:histidinol-phosphate phosphatase family protein